MRRRSLLLGAALALLAGSTVPVHAAPLGNVEVHADWVTVPRGDGVATVAVCRAVATGTEPEVVPVATEVDCSIDGAARSAVAPGALAVTVQTSTAPLPVVVCVAGRAAFLDTATNDVFSVVAAAVCVTVGQPSEER